MLRNLSCHTSEDSVYDTARHPIRVSRTIYRVLCFALPPHPLYTIPNAKRMSMEKASPSTPRPATAWVTLSRTPNGPPFIFF